MAISDAASDYTNTNGAGLLGSNSVTNVTIPTHSIALISFHYYETTTANLISAATLDGQSATLIDRVNDGTNNGVSVFWATGASAGSSKTLAYTVVSNDMTFPVGISISFLAGTETVSPIRGFASDADNGGGSGVTGLSFSAGDWTVLAYTCDPTSDPTNSSANTVLIPKYTITTLGSEAGQVYKTANGTIAISGGGYSAAVGFTVKAAGGGGSSIAVISNYYRMMNQ